MMTPYNYQNFTHPPYEHQYTSSNEYTNYTPSGHYDVGSNRIEHHNRDEIITSLLEKLADRDAEIRKLGSENCDLKNELRHSEELMEQEVRKVETLQSECDDLRESLDERDEEYRMIVRENDELLARQQGLKITCSKLERALGAREEELASIEMKLEAARDEVSRVGYRRDVDVSSLEHKLEDLEKEVDYNAARAREAELVTLHLRDREKELKSILTENDLMLEQQEKEISRLMRASKGLEYDADTQISMLEEQEQDISNMKRMIMSLNNVIKSQDTALDKKENVIVQLSVDIERYEKMVEEAEHFTWEQRQKTKVEAQDREKMIAEIEMLKDELKQERSGLLCLLGKGCGAKL